MGSAGIGNDGRYYRVLCKVRHFFARIGQHFLQQPVIAHMACEHQYFAGLEQLRVMVDWKALAQQITGANAGGRCLFANGYVSDRLHRSVWCSALDSTMPFDLAPLPLGLSRSIAPE